MAFVLTWYLIGDPSSYQFSGGNSWPACLLGFFLIPMARPRGRTGRWRWNFAAWYPATSCPGHSSSYVRVCPQHDWSPACHLSNVPMGTSLHCFLPWKSPTPLSRPWFASVAVPRPESKPPSWFQWAATCRLLIPGPRDPIYQVRTFCCGLTPRSWHPGLLAHFNSWSSSTQQGFSSRCLTPWGSSS